KHLRILCWFMTDGEILEKAKRVRDTWAKNCDITLFMSSTGNPDFPAIGLNVTSGRDHIANKSRTAWNHVYRYYRNQADFFMKSDPDSYVSIPNLRLFLSGRDPTKPELYGHALHYGFQKWMGNFSGFYSAGQSVVLTRVALVKMVSG
ncbi:hypothetical protein HELRODRAFT_144773, partial [Helobdella robusta]|uniref:N-acetylgalactosaminide beta-1,3-galactosyltransferase n=1 Tax=Helobdella robusta TaxID=6412 RepID=T1EJG2_HELRO